MAEDDLQSWTEHDGTTASDEAMARSMRALLCRVEAPEGFTERMLARVEASAPDVGARHMERPRRGVLLQFTRPAWRAAYAAAALLALTAGGLHLEHARAEQRRAEQASAQFDTALQVTDHALNHVSAKLETTEFGQVQRALEATGGGK